jgi:hypothetical protein
MLYDLMIAALMIGATGCLIMAALLLTRGKVDWEDTCTYARHGKGPDAPGIPWWSLAGWCVLGSLLWLGAWLMW